MTENAFIQEVDDALKQERLEKLWKKYGNFIIIAVIALVVGTAAITGWKSWNKRQNEIETKRLVNILETGDFEGKDFLDFLNNTRPGHKAIALLNAAGSSIEREEKEKARSLYISISNDPSIDSVYRDLATIMNVRLGLSDEEVNHTELLPLLEPIVNAPENPWYPTALFHKALLIAHGKKDLKKATDTLNLLLDSDKASPTLKEQARALVHVYTLTQEEDTQ